MTTRRTFFKRLGAAVAGVAASVYCPAVLGKLLEDPNEGVFRGYRVKWSNVDDNFPRTIYMSQQLADSFELSGTLA